MITFNDILLLNLSSLESRVASLHHLHEDATSNLPLNYCIFSEVTLCTAESFDAVCLLYCLRTVARKFSIGVLQFCGGLFVCAGGLDITQLTKTLIIYSVSRFNLGAWSFVWGAKPTKAPVATGLYCLLVVFTSFLCPLQRHFILRVNMGVAQCSVLNASYSAFVTHPAFGTGMTPM